MKRFVRPLRAVEQAADRATVRFETPPGQRSFCKSRERLEALLQDATTKEASYADFLDTLLPG